MQNSKRNLLLYVGLLVLAGLFHVIEHTIHDISALGEPHYAVVTLFFCLELVIYTVLIIFWIQSVHTRLLPSRARNYMVIVALLMIFYLVLRAYKYRIAGEDAGLRLSWYAYYIPMTFIPALFLMVCIRIKKGSAKLKVDEKVFLIPAAVLSGLIMTNDLHHLIFVPQPGLSNFIGKSGTYTYRVTFYITYAWIVLATLAGIILLIRTFGLKQKRRLLYLGGIIAVWVILTQLHTLKKFIEFTPPYETPEIHIFTMLAVFEFAIRQRLIPYNENYAGFFASLPMPVIITDKKYNPVYRSAGSIDLEPGLLTEALKAPIYPIPDGKLSGRPIRGGYTFWIEDEREIRHANEELNEANELLKGENTLIEYENNQKEENAYLRLHHHIYHEIAQEMYPYQKRIEDLLNEASNTGNNSGSNSGNSGSGSTYIPVITPTTTPTPTPTPEVPGTTTKEVKNTDGSKTTTTRTLEESGTDYESWMPDFIGGLAKGIEKSRSMIENAMNGITSDMTITPRVMAAQGGYSGGGVNGGDLISGINTALNTALAGGGAAGDIVIPVYIGGDMIDEMVVTAQQRMNLRSGGR